MADGEKLRPRGVRVKARSRVAIRTLTDLLRAEFGEARPYVDVADFVEHKLYQRFGIVLAPKPRSVLGLDEGRTYPDQLRIELRNDVYEALIAGESRARFTAMHEVGHVFLHQGVALLHTTAPADHLHFEDSEWQSDAFAAEFLMPACLIRQMRKRTAAEAVRAFGVSMKAALVRFSVLRAEGVIPMG
jgi:Zn-dependent peptidase ImmA (M78 family)